MKQLITGLLLFLFALISPLGSAFAADEIAQTTAQLLVTSDSPIVDTRVKRLEAYLTKFDGSFKSPLAQEAEYIIEEADKYRVDWRLIVAIAGVESTFCKHIPKDSHNCWGWGIPTGAPSGLSFVYYKEAITAVTKGLRENYIDRGYHTPEKMGSMYAASPRWATNVHFFINEIEQYNSIDSEDLELTL